MISAKVELDKKNLNHGIVLLDEPEFGVAPGQACVFYNNFQKNVGRRMDYNKRVEIIPIFLIDNKNFVNNLLRFLLVALNSKNPIL